MEAPRKTDNPHYRKRHNAILPFLGFAIAVLLIGLTINVLASSQLKNDDNTARQSSAGSEQIVIDVDEQGKFVPEALVIKPGTEVIWQNADDEQMSVVVDTSDNNSSGQQIETLSSKLFETQGTYNFWDPQNPKLGGQIIVN